MARCGDGLDSCWAVGKAPGRRASGERKEAHAGGDTHAHNTFESPDAVRPETHAIEASGSPRAFSASGSPRAFSASGAIVRYTFPPASVTRLEIALS